MGFDTKTATGVRACRTGFRPNRGACLRRPIRKRRTCGGSRERRAFSLGHRIPAAGAVRKLADLLKVTVGFEAVDGRHVRHMHAVEAAVFDDHVQHALLPRRFKIRVDGVAAQRAHRTDKRVRAPIRRAGHHQPVGRHRAGDVLAVVDHPFDGVVLHTAHADLVAAVAHADRVQAEQRELAQRRGPFGDVDAAHVVRAAVARRPDAFDVDERIDMFGFGKVDDAVEPGVKTALGIGIRRDQHVVVRQETQCGRANHRRAAFVADQPCVAANRTQCHAYFQRTQRAVRFRSGLRGLRNVEAGDHQRAGGPTFLAARQVACGSEQIAARIRHQRFGTASDVGSRHACDTRDFRIIPPIQHAHVAFLPWSGFCFCDCDALRVRGVRFTRRPAAVSAGRRVN